jgi:hypothetical protein
LQILMLSDSDRSLLGYVRINNFYEKNPKSKLKFADYNIVVANRRMESSIQDACFVMVQYV